MNFALISNKTFDIKTNGRIVLRQTISGRDIKKGEKEDSFVRKGYKFQK